MKRFIDAFIAKYSRKTWLQVLMLFIPFTGIINPLWYTFLVFFYFGWMVYYYGFYKLDSE